MATRPKWVNNEVSSIGTCKFKLSAIKTTIKTYLRTYQTNIRKSPLKGGVLPLKARGRAKQNFIRVHTSKFMVRTFSPTLSSSFKKFLIDWSQIIVQKCHFLAIFRRFRVLFGPKRAPQGTPKRYPEVQMNKIMRHPISYKASFVKINDVNFSQLC